MKKKPAILFLLPVLLLLLSGSPASLKTRSHPIFLDTTLPDTIRTAQPQRNAGGLAAGSGASVADAAGSRTAAVNPVTDLSLEDLVPPAPSAMEIAKGIAYPVDLSNGLLNIEIPLYEIVSGDIRIPITLSYHASGLKPGIISRSWLPQGWSLSAGPTLTRVIHGGPDEYVYNATLASASSLTREQLASIADQTNDIALDEFYYSLPGHSGRLYFTRTPAGNSSVTITPVTIPTEPLAVTLPSGNGDFDRQVDITDPRGVRYRFGSPDDNSYLDRTGARFGASVLDAATSWKIRTVTSATTGGTVAFEYTSPYTETTFYNFSDALTMIDGVTGQVSYTSPLIRPSVGGSSASPLTYVYSDSTAGHITPVDPSSVLLPQGYTFPSVSSQSESHQTTYPSKITFPGGTVTFTRASTPVTGGYRLAKISIKSSDGTLIREITFNQSADPEDGELRLEGLTVSSGSATPESWSFSYNGQAPPRQTRDIDRWGYYNHAGNSTLVPTVTAGVLVNRFPQISFTDTVTVPGGNREPDEEYMQGGILTSVTYPTGGRAEFTYEAHRYAVAGSSRPAGGLRIRSVKETAASGRTVWRHFFYGTESFNAPASATGTGILSVSPYSGTAEATPTDLIYRETSCHEFQPPATLTADYKERVWSDNSMVSLFSDHGSPVVYPYVLETVSPDATCGSIAGATLHRFNVSTSRPIINAGTTLVTDSRDGWTRGEETSSLTIRSDGSTYKTAGELSQGYTLELSQGTVKTGQVYRGHRVYGTDEMYVGDQYKAISHVWSLLTTGRKLLVSRTESVIESNGTLTTGETFTYDSRNNISEHTVTGSARSGASSPKRITKYSYAWDISSTVNDAMKAANLVAIPVKVEEYVNSTTAANRLSTRTTTYKAVSAGPASPSRTLYVKEGESLTVDAAPSDGSAPSSGSRTLSYGTYDRRGNVMERTGLDGRTEVWLWGYRGQYPVARIRGASLNAVLSRVDTSRLNTGTQSQVAAQLSSLRNAWSDNASVHVETWTWQPLVGLSTATDPSGRSFSWEYDGLGRLTAAYAHDGTAPRLLESHEYSLDQTLPVPESSSGTGWNSVRTRTMLTSGGTSGACIEKTSYIDGLARVAEEVTRTSSSGFPSVVTLQEYDGFGRKSSSYLPLALESDNGGAYVTPAAAVGRSFLTYSDVYTDSYPEYEPTPRNRVIANNGPGSPWRTRGRKEEVSYLVSTTSGGGLCTCNCYEVASASSLRKRGVYGAGELSVVRTDDEDGNVSLVFSDKWGREVLHRKVITGSSYADTYYVYDNLGLLRYVLSPEASSALSSDGTWSDSDAVLQGLAYIYKYDSRGRRTYSKLPGAGAVYLRYDRSDRQVFSQDAVQRTDGLWTFTLPDFLGRECVRGTAALTETAVASAATSVPTVTFTTSSSGSALGGYTVSGVTLPQDRTLLSVRYHDSYSFLSLLPSATASGLAVSTLSGYGTAWPSNSSPGAKGLQTGSRTFVVGDGSSFSAEAVYYDWRSQPVQKHCIDHRGTREDLFLNLSFTGKTVASRKVVTPYGGAATVVTREMSYDGWDRLAGEVTTVSGGGADATDRVTYSYDDVGRMTGRTYGEPGSAGSTAETLSYNARGWLTGQASPVYSSTLRYTDPSRTSTAGRYGGSISEWSWSRGSGSGMQTYAFSYDGLDRLTGSKRYIGSSTAATDAFTEQGLEYDRNGNIKALVRYGQSAADPEDDLLFTLSGNRIWTISNSGSNGSGKTYSAFAYDANGNTTHDGRTGQDLVWNALNLLSGATVTEGGVTSTLATYTWLADGTKYSTERPDGSGYVYKGELIYTKAPGGALTLDCVLTTGGRIVAERDTDGTLSGYSVRHHIRDHLGSVRAVTDGSTGEVLETSDYLPFGTRWALTGGTQGATSTITDPSNRWRYSGKEEQQALSPALSLLDYGARMYDPTLARWLTPDPLAEKYYPLSLFSFCANNPISLRDGDGKKWENSKDKEFLIKSINERIESLNKSIQRLEKRIEKAEQKTLNERAKRLTTRRNDLIKRGDNLNKALTYIETLEKDAATFRLTEPSSNNGFHHVVKGKDEVINIEGRNTGFHLHEITHIVQSLEAGGLQFNKDGFLVNVGNMIGKIKNEVNAYKIHFSYDGYYPVKALSLDDINENTLLFIRTEDGKQVYGD